jgi:3-hydroxyacyl-[acyl-carrier-protein] dehydratase
VPSAILDGLTILSETLGPEGWRARVRVEPGGRAFQGHFEGDPVLPGIAHLAIVRHALATLHGPRAVLRELPSVRFRRVVRPGEILDVAVAGADPSGACRFEIRVGDAVAAAGTARCSDA